jgi:hypothetical protein
LRGDVRGEENVSQVSMSTSIANFKSGIIDAALAVIYPQPCAVCGDNVESRYDGAVCAKCWLRWSRVCEMLESHAHVRFRTGVVLEVRSRHAGSGARIKAHRDSLRAL